MRKYIHANILLFVRFDVNPKIRSENTLRLYKIPRISFSDCDRGITFSVKYYLLHYQWIPVNIHRACAKAPSNTTSIVSGSI
jgi:hypothetical protein